MWSEVSLGRIRGETDVKTTRLRRTFTAVTLTGVNLTLRTTNSSRQGRFAVQELPRYKTTILTLVSIKTETHLNCEIIPGMPRHNTVQVPPVFSYLNSHPLPRELEFVINFDLISKRDREPTNDTEGTRVNPGSPFPANKITLSLLKDAFVARQTREFNKTGAPASSLQRHQSREGTQSL